ncbi:MAG: RDD family protein [Bacteroidota bacterium]|nr:RDD family protein [Bacteroidota bacterium]
MQEEINCGEKLASRTDRLAAVIVDSVVVLITAFILLLIIIFSGFENFYNSCFTGSFILKVISYTFTGSVIYLPLNGYLLYKYGQTIGKRFMGIKIVDMNNKVPSLYRSYFLRSFLISLFAIIPILNFAIMLDDLFIFTKRQRCIHDYLAGTKVVDI